MNKKQYIEELRRKLRALPRNDRDDAIQYYEEYLSDMEIDDNADVVSILGDPRTIAKEIMAECADKHINAAEKSVKSDATAVWIVLALIFSAPVLFPFGIAVFAIIFSLVAVAAAFVFAGIVSMAAIAFTSGVGQGIVCGGVGIACIGLGILIAVGIISLIRWIVMLIASKNKKKND